MKIFKIKFLFNHKKYETNIDVDFEIIKERNCFHEFKDCIIKRINVLGMINEECLLCYPDDEMLIHIRELLVNEIMCLEAV